MGSIICDSDWLSTFIVFPQLKITCTLPLHFFPYTGSALSKGTPKQGMLDLHGNRELHIHMHTLVIHISHPIDLHYRRGDITRLTFLVALHEEGNTAPVLYIVYYVHPLLNTA